MAKRKAANAVFTEDDDDLLAELGVDTEVAQDQTYTAKQERMIAGFEDIQAQASGGGDTPTFAVEIDVMTGTRSPM